MAFGSLGDVENWLAVPGQTIGVLRGNVTSGAMSGENARWAKAWIDQYDAMSEAGRRDREVALQQAALDAAIKHAQEQITATERAALAAESSARFTMWAAVAAALGAVATAAGLVFQLINTGAISVPKAQPSTPPPSISAPTSAGTPAR